MSATPDPAELAPSRDPAAYGRRPLSAGGAAAWAVLCVACLGAGVALGHFGFKIIPAPAAQSTPEPAPPSRAPPLAAAPLAGAAPASVPDAAAPPSAAQLAERVTRLEASTQGDSAVAALAAAELSEAAQTSGPFDQDLAAYQRLLPTSPELRALAPLAARGAPTRAALIASLPALASQASAAARQPGRDSSALGRLAALVGRVLVVRRIDPAAPGVDGVLARAERQAGAGDLEGAVTAVKSLPDEARGPLQEWIAAADRRLEIDRRLGALRVRALAGLAPASGP